MRWLTIFALATAAAAQYTPADFNVDSNYTSFNFDPSAYAASTQSLLQFQYQARFPLTNGYIGLALAPEGPFFAEDVNYTGPGNPVPENGWPLFDERLTLASIVGFWDSQRNTTKTNFPELLKNGGESVISGIPHFGSLLLTVGNKTYQAGADNTTVSNFRTTFSYAAPVLETSLVWSPDDANFTLTYQIFVSEPRLNVAAVSLQIVASEDTNATLTDVLDGRSALRTTAGNKTFEPSGNVIWSSVQPDGLSNISAYVVSTVDFQGVSNASRAEAKDPAYVSGNASTIAQQWNITLRAGVPFTAYKYVGVASADAFPNNTAAVARNASLSAKAAGFSTLIQEHAAAWEKKWNGTIDLYTGKDDSDDIRNMQIADIASQYFLTSNLRAGHEGPYIGDRSISVGGQASDSYAGLVFWDADTFVLPGLLMGSPQYAESITNFRYALHPQALNNAKQYDYPDGASLYPWTSSRFGNCTGTGPCVDYQYHLNSDIVTSLKQTYITTGNMTWLREKAWPIINSTATMFDHLVSWNSSLKGFTIRNMTDPDEYANQVDNGAFTIGGAITSWQWAAEVAALLNETAQPSWLNKSRSMYIPYEPNTGIIEEFTGMNGSVTIKQADVVLLNFPLEFRLNKSQALRDLDWYAQAQSPDGPAMTWAIYSINAAELSPHGCSSWTYAINAFEPYTRVPWFQLSEQQIDDPVVNGGTNPAYPFLTGHGGFRQVAPFAFAGYRFHQDALYLDPYLPPHLTNVKHRNFHWHGATVQVTQNSTNTTVCRIPSDNPVLTDPTGPIPVSIGDRNAMAGNYTLAPGACLTVPTTQYHQLSDIAGNAVQCKTLVTSNASWVPGQYPLAAIDGANSTKWQPETPDPASLTVDLESATAFSGAVLLWAQAPPESFSIGISNSSSGSFQQVYTTTNVSVSNPYDAPSAFKIRPRESNFTVLNFSSTTVASRFVRLTVEGTQGIDNTTGPTVAEFAMINVSPPSGTVTKRSLNFFK